MQNYRVKTIIDQDGHKRYVPQKRFLFFFWKSLYITNPYKKKIEIWCYSFSDAKAYFKKNN